MGNKQRGFIALISIILISAVLLSILLETSYSTFWGQSEIIGSIDKEESLVLAENCVEEALVRLAQNTDYQAENGGDQYIFGSNECQISSVLKLDDKNWLIYTLASEGKAITQLESRVRTSGDSLEIVSLVEK